jgi:predicted phosphodiesterase
MRALISDIHGNLEALEAVLADARHHGATEIYCLGDLVGYGPDPIPCVELAMSWPVVLLGNFDEASTSDEDPPGWTSESARKTILQFRRILKQNKHSTAGVFLSSLQTSFLDTQALHVHGTPRDHIWEYLLSVDVGNQQKMDEIARAFDGLCFCGHTHQPGVFFITETGTWNHITPKECGNRYQVGRGKVICNVGSVGQPRDADPRACYVLYEKGTIIFRRVDYDIDRTIEKMDLDGGSGDFLGRRLREGL